LTKRGAASAAVENANREKLESLWEGLDLLAPSPAQEELQRYGQDMARLSLLFSIHWWGLEDQFKPFLLWAEDVLKDLGMAPKGTGDRGTRAAARSKALRHVVDLSLKLDRVRVQLSGVGRFRSMPLAALYLARPLARRAILP